MMSRRKKRSGPGYAPTGVAARPLLTVVPISAPPAVHEFQSDALEIEQRKPPALARITLYGVVLVVGAAVWWASVSRIDEIVAAPGRLVTSEPIMVVQPLETSIIRAIHVGQGDVVRSGQVLAELDPTITAADAQQLRTRVAAYDAQIARLEAQLAGSIYVPPTGASEDELTQGRLAVQRAASYAAKLRDYDAQFAHAEATLAAAADESEVLIRRLDGLKEIEDMRSSLSDTGNGTHLAYLQARDVTFDTEAVLTRIRGQQAEADQLLLQLQAQRQNYIEEHRRGALEELVKARDDRAAAAEELKKAELREAMVNMIAPADGAVLEVARRSIGSVVQAAEPLFTLVPLNVQLEAEVTVAADDIGHIGTGDPARIKFDAFPFQKHGTVEGEVVSISQDTFARENAATPGEAVFYKVRLAVGDIALRNLPEDFQLLPGMTVSAEINAGERSVISYFLYPLIRGLDESLREP